MKEQVSEGGARDGVGEELRERRIDWHAGVEDERGRAHHLGDGGEIEHAPAGRVPSRDRVAAFVKDLEARERKDLLVEAALEQRFEAHAKDNVRASASRRTVAPRGTGSFTSPWPMRKPVAQGIASRAASSVITSSPE